VTGWPDGICALIPVYNHAARVGAVVQSLIELGAPTLCIDDGSTDASGDVAAAAGARVVRLDGNRGKAAALRAGFAAAEGYRAVVTVDADGQHAAADALTLAQAAQAEPAALHLGVRAMPDAPWPSRWGRRLSNAGVWLCTGARVGDSQSGLRAYPLPAITALPVRAERFAFEVEVLVRAVRAGIPVHQVPVHAAYPADRISHFGAVRDSLRLCGTVCRLLVRQG
jgi:glycosyltransferase involved in cell wall biosynthesis